MSNEFKYTTLKDGEFRLIKLSRHGKDPHYQLLNINLNEAPPYFALSYTWDGQKPDHHIQCDGKSLPVTFNITKILPSLLEKNGPHLVWIDGVCINQNDDDEKGSQIPLMQQIYTKAVKVMIWLGDGDEWVEKAMTQIVDITGKLKRFKAARVITEEMLADAGLPSLYSLVWGGIHSLLSRGWFTRVWVFQEVILARIAEVIYGSQVIPLQDVIDLRQAISSAQCTQLLRGTKGNKDIDVLRGDPGMNTLHIISLYKTQQDSGRKFNLVSLVETARDWYVFDPRDRVYGMLGLVDDRVRRYIKVDYTQQTPAQVYLDLAKYAVKIKLYPNLLHRVFKDGEVDSIELELPSWCLNFSKRRDIVLIGSEISPFSAGFRDPNISFQPYLAPNTTSLQVMGFQVDEVKEIVPGTWRSWLESPRAGELSSAEESFMWETRCFELSKKVYGNKEAAVEAHAHTLIADQINGRKRCTSSQRKAYESWKSELSVRARRKRLRSGAGMDIRDAIFNTYLSAVNSAARNHRFFSTVGGRIGMGPFPVKAGDKICIICNTYTPFILDSPQEIRDHFKVVGEAYVHGLMYGEAFGVVEENLIREISLD
ncbi:hypothetical protein B7463_g4858, partial [Scytalidium lignicola]